MNRREGFYNRYISFNELVGIDNWLFTKQVGLSGEAVAGDLCPRDV
jgi:hypothetical protein